MTTATERINNPWLLQGPKGYLLKNAMNMQLSVKLGYSSQHTISTFEVETPTPILGRSRHSALVPYVRCSEPSEHRQMPLDEEREEIGHRGDWRPWKKEEA